MREQYKGPEESLVGGKKEEEVGPSDLRNSENTKGKSLPEPNHDSCLQEDQLAKDNSLLEQISSYLREQTNKVLEELIELKKDLNETPLIEQRD